MTFDLPYRVSISDWLPRYRPPVGHDLPLRPPLDTPPLAGVHHLYSEKTPGEGGDKEIKKLKILDKMNKNQIFLKFSFKY